MQLPPRLISSFAFVANIATTFILGQRTYCFLFSLLLLTSIIVHHDGPENDYDYTFFVPLVMDKISVLAVVTYGGYAYLSSLAFFFGHLAHERKQSQVTTTTASSDGATTTTNNIVNHNDTFSLYRHLLLLVVPITFLLTVYLYLYGHATSQFCFASDASTASAYHATMHIVSAIGHVAIALLFSQSTRSA